ncbi:uncharacterized protein OCT59_027144 [Rhizophagus irregularis]|uniref:uncharacterized protein n=1 Tax=Rhizophagus irregularis TaxID=588596 RepID=UPI0033339325|nr:hypothetical protein OCT59_027144 [Rhizophagus irregularis]
MLNFSYSFNQLNSYFKKISVTLVGKLFRRCGDENIDKFILEKNLKWIPYNEFKNIVYLDKGGFSIIYKATWLNNNGNKEVVLKCHNNLNENSNQFLNEWKNHERCLNSYDIINFYGFTRSPDTLRYMVVMDYANKGNFRGNLTKIIKNDWKQKLHMLHRIISGLNEIHKQKLIHCDFHDGNILNHKDEENGENKENESEENKESEKNEESENYENVKVYISDLGLCQPIKSFLKKYEIYGVIPFMAPEILRGKHFTPASDIYSFSMIMWEFTSGVPPFNDEAHDFQLSLSICRGGRPKIIKNTPQCYVDLMKKCWDEDPLKRPSSKEVLNIIEEWIILPYEKEIEDISKELKSRVLDFTSKKLNKYLESECLDNCRISNDINSLDIETDEN